LKNKEHSASFAQNDSDSDSDEEEQNLLDND